MNRQDILKLIIGLIFIICLFNYLIDINKLLLEATKINLLFLAMAILAYLCLDIFGAIRFYYSVRWVGYKISFKESFWTHIYGMLWSNITPGRAGYVSVIHNLKKKTNLPYSEGLGLVGLVNSTDFLMKAIGAFLALLFVFFYFGKGEIIFFGALSIIFVTILPLGFIAILWKRVSLIEKIINSIPFFGKKLNETIESMRTPFSRIKNKLPHLMLFAFCFWVIRGIEWTFIGKASNIELPFIIFFLLHPLLTTIRLVPITPAGLGLFEGAVILGFSLFGVPPENAILLSFLDRLDNIFVDIFSLRELKKI